MYCCHVHPLVSAAPPIPRGRAAWKPQWDELKDFTDNEVIVSGLPVLQHVVREFCCSLADTAGLQHV